MVGAGALYHLIMKLWNTEMYSAKLVNLHFWMATIGAVVYITAMWVSGIMQGLMWRDYDEFGTLTYTFAESVSAMHPYYAMRAIGGMIYWAGGAIMLYNTVMTIRMASGQRSASASAATA
jgi:cytochrome c oxidase cbb3-type subunit 1